MEVIITLLFALHVLSFVAGMGSGLAQSVIGPNYQKADEGQRALLLGIGKTLGKIGRYGLVGLWVTGLLILFLKFGDLAAMSWVFWLKMAMVVVLSGSIGMGAAAFRKFANGDIAAGARMAKMGRISGITAILIVLVATFAFG